MLACSTAAEWAWERKVPLVYYGSHQKWAVEDIVRFRQQYPDTLPFEDISRDASELIESNKSGRNGIFTRPAWLVRQLLPRYAKVTSPLRRYGDLINHWQLESVIRYEMDSGKSSVTDGPEPLPELRKALEFSERQLAIEILQLKGREEVTRLTQDASNTFWLSHMLYRAFHQGECKVPDTFSLQITVPFIMGQRPRVQMDLLDGRIGVRFDVTDSVLREAGGYRPLDRWEVAFNELDPQISNVGVKMVKLLDRADDEVVEKYVREAGDIVQHPLSAPQWT